jgi:hypothetical protein
MAYSTLAEMVDWDGMASQAENMAVVLVKN